MAWPRWWFDPFFPPVRFVRIFTHREPLDLVEVTRHPVRTSVGRAMDTGAVWVADWVFYLLSYVTGLPLRWFGTSRYIINPWRRPRRYPPMLEPPVFPSVPTPGAVALEVESFGEAVVRLLLAEPAIAPLFGAAGLALVVVALATALGQALLPATGLHRDRFYDRWQLPVLHYGPDRLLTALRIRLVDRLSRRPPVHLLRWTRELQDRPRRLLSPLPTAWFLPALALATAYDAAACLAWVAAWGPIRANRSLLVFWDDRFSTWPRLRRYTLWLDRRPLRAHGLRQVQFWWNDRWNPLLWRTRLRVSRLYWARYPGWLPLPVARLPVLPAFHFPRHPPWVWTVYPLPRSLLGPKGLHPVAARPLETPFGFPRRLWEWIPFALLGPQLLAATAYGGLERFRRWPPWARPLRIRTRWSALLVRSYVRRVAFLGLVLVPVHAYGTLFLQA